MSLSFGRVLMMIIVAPGFGSTLLPFIINPKNLTPTQLPSIHYLSISHRRFMLPVVL